MAKNAKSKLASKRANIRDLPKRGKKLTAKESKKVHGGVAVGDFNRDGIDDLAYTKPRSPR